MSASADSLKNGAIPAINFSELFSQEELRAKLRRFTKGYI